MAKKIHAFKSMCQDDQIALLKGSCTEMMILRSIIQYDFEQSTWAIPHHQREMSKIKTDILKLANNNAFEEYDKFIRSFDEHLRNDENIILIMSAIVLFTSDRAKTVHTDVIIFEQVAKFNIPLLILLIKQISAKKPTKKNSVFYLFLFSSSSLMFQNSYYYLLRRYLESIHQGCEAKSHYLKLIQKIKELECLKNVLIAVYLDVNPNQIEPLLCEIFDIK